MVKTKNSKYSVTLLNKDFSLGWKHCKIFNKILSSLVIHECQSGKLKLGNIGKNT